MVGAPPHCVRSHEGIHTRLAGGHGPPPHVAPVGDGADARRLVSTTTVPANLSWSAWRSSSHRGHSASRTLIGGKHNRPTSPTARFVAARRSTALDWSIAGTTASLSARFPTVAPQRAVVAISYTRLPTHQAAKTSPVAAPLRSSTSPVGVLRKPVSNVPITKVAMKRIPTETARSMPRAASRRLQAVHRAPGLPSSLAVPDPAGTGAPRGQSDGAPCTPPRPGAGWSGLGAATSDGMKGRRATGTGCGSGDVAALRGGSTREACWRVGGGLAGSDEPPRSSPDHASSCNSCRRSKLWNLADPPFSRSGK